MAGDTAPRRRTLGLGASRARLPDRTPTRPGDAAVKGSRSSGRTGRPSDRPTTCGVGADVDGRHGDRPMTTDKAFKRVVRARMAKTGERYAAARRSLIESDTDIPTSASTVEIGRGPDDLPTARWPASRDRDTCERPRQPRRGLRPDRRAIDRGDDPRDRRRAGCRVHPLGVQEPRSADPDARVPQPVAVPVDPGLDRQDPRTARHRSRRSPDRRREGRPGGTRCSAGRRSARHRIGRSPGDRDVGPARRALRGISATRS